MKRLFLLLPLLFATPLRAHPDPSHTLEEIEKHLAEHPGDPMLLLRKGEVLLASGHPEKALAVAKSALVHAPDDPAVRLLAARIAETRGDSKAASEAIEQITRDFPTFPAAWGNAARLRHEAGQTDGAIAAKLRHLELEEHLGPGDFLTASGWLRDRGREGDIDAAIAILDRAIVKFGPLTGLQQSAIKLESAAGRPEAALARVDILVAKNRPSVHFSLLRAGIHEAAGDHAQAAAACDSALALLAVTQPAENGSPALEQKILRRKEENLSRAACR